MANFNQGTGEQRHNILGNTGTKKGFKEHGNKALLKGRQKLKKLRGTYLPTFSLHPCRQHFFLQSVCMELWQRLNWGMSMSYECTLGDWMLSKINHNQIGGKEEHSRGVKLQ